MIAKNKKSGKREFQQTVFLSTLIGVLALAIIGFLIVSNLKMSKKRAELTLTLESLKKEFQLLEQKKEQLEAGIIMTEDESYWEEKMREQGYKKPGEEAVVVLPPEENEEKSAEKEKNFLEKILDWFGQD